MIFQNILDLYQNILEASREACSEDLIGLEERVRDVGPGSHMLLDPNHHDLKVKEPWRVCKSLSRNHFSFWPNINGKENKIYSIIFHQRQHNQIEVLDC